MRLLAMTGVTAGLVAGMAALLSGCITTGSGGSTLLVKSDPPGALVTVEGAGECETPCTVRLDGAKRATIAKAGFVTVNTVLSPERRSLTIPMELAAASEGVDTTALPDLD